MLANFFSAVWVGWVCALIGAIAFSGKAILAKLMYRHGADATLVLFWRMTMALPFFVAMGWWSSRGQPALSPRSKLHLVLLGVFGYYLASYLDFLGLERISANLERLILYLNPTIVLLFGVIFFAKSVTRRQGVALGLSYLGVLMAFAHEMKFDGMNTVWGGLLVLGSATSYAIYLTGSGALVKRIGSLRLVGWASTTACGLTIAQALVLKPVAVLAATPVPVLWLSLVNALACTVAPVWLVMLGVARLGPAAAAQIGMVGPLSTILLSVWFLDERLTAWTIGGTVLVIAGVALLASWACAPANKN
jgi:drug/metabolite transporter (DMT)-like permease